MPSLIAAPSPRLTVDDKAILFVDLEASGLSNLSYPIEIGWASLSADGRQLQTDAILIRPDADWRENGEWSMDAQRMHGLSMKEIRTQGADVMDVVPRFEAAIAGCILTSDAPQEDSFWIERLYDAAGRRFQGRIQALRAIRMSLIAQRGVSPRLAFERLDFAAARDPIPHRAGPDAARMARLTGLMLGLGEVKECEPE
jgi:hypothetical protein